MIIPSLLTDNQRVAQERIVLAQKMSGWLHVDIVDNSLYPGKSLDWQELADLDYGQLKLEVHCMTANPEAILGSRWLFERFIISNILPDWRQVIERHNDSSFTFWLAIDPDTSITTLELPPDLGGVVMMGVHPGASGQEMLPDTLDRASQLKDYHQDLPLSIDGGVRDDNIRRCLATGADNLNVATALWGAHNPVATYEKLTQLADPVGGILNPFQNSIGN